MNKTTVSVTINQRNMMMDGGDVVDNRLLMYFFVMAEEMLDVIDKEESSLLRDHIKEQRKLCRSLPTEKTRPTWTGFCNKVSDSHFHRQFRMSRNAFTNLCSISISTAVGEETFVQRIRHNGRHATLLPFTVEVGSFQEKSKLQLHFVFWQAVRTWI